jgi:hypothetical protein
MMITVREREREVYKWEKMLKTGRTVVGAHNSGTPSVAVYVEVKTQID